MRDPVPVSVPGMYGCAPVHRLRRCSVTPQQRAAEPCDSLTQDLRERGWLRPRHEAFESTVGRVVSPIVLPIGRKRRWSDRKSTRLNSSHLVISYAVFCLKKKQCPHSACTP